MEMLYTKNEEPFFVLSKVKFCLSLGIKNKIFKLGYVHVNLFCNSKNGFLAQKNA